MDQALRKPMTPDEFLAWERRQEMRYEFNGFEPVAMTGGTVAHSVIATNVVTALQSRLRGGQCRPFRGDLKIIVDGRIRYPDALVTRSPIGEDAEVISEPVVVFEVLSANTAVTDRITKNAEYRATPSIQHYVMLEQSAAASTVFSRSGEEWSGRLVTDPDAVLNLPAIGIDLPLAEIYAGIELSDVETDD
jgi:Uma2 family endonuclease